MRKFSENNSFANFLNGYPGLVSCDALAEEINYCQLSIDSRTITPGALYVSLRGENHDGHDFALSALEKGASAVVVEDGWWALHRTEYPVFADHSTRMPVIIVHDSLDFLQQLGAWHRRQFDVPVIGITGSNGKTTTREMIATVLEQRYTVFRSSGNKNNHIGLPLMLLQLDDNIDVAVLELGTNHPGEIALLANLAKPTAAVITNIGKGHIGFFGTEAAVYHEKTALFDAVSAKQPIFVNVEDKYLKNYPLNGRNVVTVGWDKSCKIWATPDGQDKLGCPRFLLNGKQAIQLKIPGQHNIMNALMAAAIGFEWGLTDQEIADALQSFVPTNQRMQLIEKNGILIINDAYNANPNSMHAAIRYLSDLPCDGKRIAVLGDMLELGEFSDSEHAQLGKMIAQTNVDILFTYGTAARLIHDSAVAIAGDSIIAKWCESHEEIGRELNQVLSTGDALLLKGSRGMRIEAVLNYIKF